MKNSLFAFLIITVFIQSCSDSADLSDAYGNFEAIEVTVSSESQGKVTALNIEEGLNLDSGKIVAQTDTVALWLKYKQVESQKKAVSAKVANILSQVNVQEQQKKNLLSEKQRIEKLLKDKAVPEKQLDDINNAIAVIEKQIESIKTQNQAVFSELDGIDFQLKQIRDQMNRCYTVNPINGTVLEKYIEQSEMVVPGRAMYKIANLNYLILRAYVDEKQLGSLKLGQKTNVTIDDGNGGLKVMEGKVIWISSQAEFTPKIIQTREERQNLVYAIKIKVKNDGSIKIGMPGEAKF